MKNGTTDTSKGQEFVKRKRENATHRNSVHIHSCKVRSKNKWSPETHVRKGSNVLVMIFCMHVSGARWCISSKIFLMCIIVHSKLKNCGVQHLLACLQVVLWLFIQLKQPKAIKRKIVTSLVHDKCVIYSIVCFRFLGLLSIGGLQSREYKWDRKWMSKNIMWASTWQVSSKNSKTQWNMIQGFFLLLVGTKILLRSGCDRKWSKNC